MELKTDKKEFIARLEKLIGSEKPYVWASNIGLPPATFTRMWKEGILPSASNLIRITEATGVSLDWLLTGRKKGPGYESAFIEIPRLTTGIREPLTTQEEMSVDALSFKREWILSRGWDPASLRVVLARGKSMEPTLAEGAVLLVDISQKAVNEEGIYILESGEHLVARRIQRMFNGGGIKIKSDNPAYDDQIVTQERVDSIEIIGRVVWGGIRL